MRRHFTRLVGTVLRHFRQSTKRTSAAGVGPTPPRRTRLVFESLEDRRVLAASFFAPLEPSGSVSVQLVPLGNVTAGSEEIVTFGIPFTRGSVSPSQLSLVRVLKNGQEIPAFVEQLTPWRSIDNPGIDGQSVRVARIQIAHTFAGLAPEAVTVEWGGSPRLLHRPVLQDPRAQWHTVTSGSFSPADGVEEPDVLPVLPAAFLSKGMLDAPTLPLPSGVAETRDDPAVMDARTFTGYTEYEYAQKNFFYTTINQNPGITIDYRTQAEPWLYDRAGAMYGLYLRSGFATALREAVRNTDFYADRLNASGFFTLRAGDPKYAYNEPLAYTYWLLGDDRMLAPISSVVSAHQGTPSRWSPSLNFWTERNVGYKLLANVTAYEVTGNSSYRANVQSIVNDLIWHQNGAGGQLPGNRVDGGLYHRGDQHDASEVDDPNVLIASSWLSALIVDPMVRAYGVWQNPQIGDFLVRMGQFENAASKTDAGGQFGGTTRYPDYLMRVDGTSENRSDTDVQHAIDVGTVAAWATYFAELRGTPDDSLRQLANDLYATYDIGVNYWTRPGGTNFNVSPPRRYAWEYKNSASFSWLLTGTGAPAQPGALQFAAASYTVNERDGAATITVSRTGGSAGSVSVAYATTSGTATAGSDYLPVSGTLTFADGETSRTFTLPVIDDGTVEGAETVLVTLTGPAGGAALGSPATATLTIHSDDTSGQPVTASWQQGVHGYMGTTDVNISTQYAQYTGGNGTTSVDSTQMGVYQTTGSTSYTVESLIRFSDLGIPSGAVVSGASLTLSVDTWTAGPTLRGYYVLAPWSAADAPSSSRLGWLHQGTGRDWAVPGALGQGTDAVAGRGFVLPGIRGNGRQSITVSLDPEMVQRWLDQPSANQGILLVNETPGAIVRIDASEHATAAYRPRLEVTYAAGVALPTMTQQPPSQTVLEGQPVTFSVAAASGLPLTFQWQRMDHGGTSWANIHGAVSSSYTFGPTSMSDHGDQFRCIVSSSAGSTYSDPATLTVTAITPPAPPPPPAPTPVGVFTDVTAVSGVGAIVAQKYQETPNWWLSGQHFVDLDQDGDLDLYLSNHGGGSVVAMNDGQGVFHRVTTGSIPDTEIHQMYDLNEDGRIDVSMTYQDGGGRWWINQSTPGAVNFTATSVTRGTNTARSQVMLDVNRDGKVDWLRSAPPGLVVDFGTGTGSFMEGSLAFPVPQTSSNNNASFLPADYDSDGDVDLLIVTGGAYDGTDGRTAYWRNNGDLTFTDVTVGAGIRTNGAVAKGIGDFDQDGDTDFLAIEHRTMPPVIYVNNGAGSFSRRGDAIRGIAADTLEYSFWGTAVSTDFDNDGVLDILMKCKYYLKVLRGVGGGNFTYQNAAWGIRDVAASAVDDGLSFGDFDADGDLDIVGYDQIWPTRTLHVYRNNLAPQNWLNVRPVGLAGNRGAAGAKIRIYAAGTDQLLWFEQVAVYNFQAAASYYGYGETERHFGLGSREAVDVEVEFPGTGRVSRVNHVTANQTVRVLESLGSLPGTGSLVQDEVWRSWGAAWDAANAQPEVAAGGPSYGEMKPGAVITSVGAAHGPEGLAAVVRGTWGPGPSRTDRWLSAGSLGSFPGEGPSHQLVDELLADDGEPCAILDDGEEGAWSAKPVSRKQH